jgi:hypothetical protein
VQASSHGFRKERMSLSNKKDSVCKYLFCPQFPWSESPTEKCLEQMGADLVEILKLMKHSEWEWLFVDEKHLQSI